MAKARVGLIYHYDTEWVAGSYYILNLIYALNTQPDNKKPELIIFCQSKAEFKTIQKTGYPYLKFVKIEEAKQSQKPTNWIHNRRATKTTNTLAALDVLFPASQEPYFDAATNKIFWIPDFQEHYLPEFFSKEEIANRKRYQAELIATGWPIVFSSHDARSDFKRFYPKAKSKTFVMPFAVTHPVHKQMNQTKLKDTFGIVRPYFFCANQFWAHKNHLVILKALSQLKKQGITDYQVVFSGKQSDYRNPEFFKSLKVKVAEMGLEQYCLFLGFIERQDQLALMDGAIAIIQPSLFEGWSTVVEDAKSLNQRIILSDLKVHHEQLPLNATYFTPTSERELAKAMRLYLVSPPVIKRSAYDTKVRTFGKTFIELVTAVMPKRTE